MNKIISYLLMAVLCACTFTSPASSGQQQTHEQWLAERLHEATSVREGMSRADLLKVFEEDGGLQRIPAGRYVLKSCRLIQVEVDFATRYGREYRPVPDAELRITKISAPYLAYPAVD